MSPYSFAPLLGRRLSNMLLTPIIRLMLWHRLGRYNSSTIAAIGRSLRVDRHAATRIFKRSLSCFARFNIEYLLTCLAGVDQMLARTEAIEIQGVEKLTPFLESNRPVLLVTMHMGNFQLGFLKLLSSIQTRRKLSVFKMSKADRNEAILLAAYKRQGHDVTILRATEDGGRQAFMELRRGNVVAMTVDLEVHVTTRQTVEFFGHACQMQSGPAQLAVMTRAVVIPVQNYINAQGREVLRVDDPLYPDAGPAGESNRQAVGRLTQGIAANLEAWIRIDPNQVMFWSGLAETIWHQLPAAAPGSSHTEAVAP
ncbi:lysophospholipid acyltransferase family protein [Massilia sp. TWP1-3-3]|uniref:lysophospholipid acyltransferase family protein n=1 Tax=Massilia sp. TWP1-3-3 TaxID=2804573 RepID=UPI003CEA061A